MLTTHLLACTAGVVRGLDPALHFQQAQAGRCFTFRHAVLRQTLACRNKRRAIASIISFRSIPVLICAGVPLPAKSGLGSVLGARTVSSAAARLIKRTQIVLLSD